MSKEGDKISSKGSTMRWAMVGAGLAIGAGAEAYGGFDNLLGIRRFRNEVLGELGDIHRHEKSYILLKTQ